MMYALGDMDEVICLAGALCKTWALLFTGEFGLLWTNQQGHGRLTHVRREVWPQFFDVQWEFPTYPRARGSLEAELSSSSEGEDLPTCAGEFGPVPRWRRSRR